ncbi:MAG: hypothetical protein HY815_21265 [Candidatus Riflebacteria bacterium]|nr:hypothetical protein [Candidatus Riflebacteria bacterium]
MQVHRVYLAAILGFVAGWFALGLMHRPIIAAGEQTDKMLSELQQKFTGLQQVVDRITKQSDQLQSEVSRLSRMIQSPTAGGAGKVEKRVAVIEKQVSQLLSHTHEYMLEGRAQDGSTHVVRPEQMMSQGLTGTGNAKIGRPILGN